LYQFSSVPSWKDALSNSANMGKNQLSLTIKNNIDLTNTKPMTYSCLNTTVSSLGKHFVKYELKRASKYRDRKNGRRSTIHRNSDRLHIYKFVVKLENDSILLMHFAYQVRQSRAIKNSKPNKFVNRVD